MQINIEHYPLSYQSCRRQLHGPVETADVPTVPGDEGQKRRWDGVPGGDATHDHYDGAEFMPMPMSGRRRNDRTAEPTKNAAANRKR